MFTIAAEDIIIAAVKIVAEGMVAVRSRSLAHWEAFRASASSAALKGSDGLRSFSGIVLVH